MRPAIIDGEEVLVFEEIRFDYRQRYRITPDETKEYSGTSRIDWHGVKPEAVTESVASRLRNEGIEPEEHDIRVAGDGDWI